MRSSLYGVVVEAPFALSSRGGPETTSADLVLRVTPPAEVPTGRLPGRALGVQQIGDRLLQEVSVAADGALHIRLSGHLYAVISPDRSEALLTPAPGDGEAYLKELAVGPVLALWLLVTRRQALHASAVAIEGRAVLSAGSSGAGKSTIEAALAAGGAVSLTGDIARVEQIEGVWCCHAGPGRVRQREQAPSLTAASSPTAEGDGRRAVVPMPASDPVPIGAVCVPIIDPAVTDVVVGRLQRAESVAALMARPRMATLAHGEFAAAAFAFCSEFAAAIPVWEVRLPRGAADAGFGDRLWDALEQLLDLSAPC